MVVGKRSTLSCRDGFFLAEEKKGGPARAIFDGAREKGKRVSISLSSANNPNYSWCGERLGEGVVPYKKAKDLIKLFPDEKTPRKKREIYVDPTPSLFD